MNNRYSKRRISDISIGDIDSWTCGGKEDILNNLAVKMLKALIVVSLNK